MQTYKIIGLMSGTSLDGLDMAYCHYTFNNGKWNYNIICTQQITYDQVRQNQLKKAIHLPVIELLELHHSYGKWLGEQVKQFIDSKNLEVDFIASHGHTIHHQPQRGVTYQIGCGQHLSNVCKKPVVNDFRSGDLALGGQGAPLVPIGDRYLFGEYDFCLNLGGISNISLEENGIRIAYDIGIANMVLNYLCQKIGKQYDNNGDIARKGSLNKNIFEQLNNLPYYSQTYPKSTGYEWFINEIHPIIEKANDSVENLLCTSVHHIAHSIGCAVNSHTTENNNSRMLVTGGGALNAFLIENIRKYVGNTLEVVVPERKIIDYKEALVFGFLGVLRERQEVNVLRSVTGAKRDSCGGIFYFPQ
ncbi:MAG: anhydro-N-acetylmuramic acid kinase [Capnocytophaga sp.]|nr:anhydro-N-acetylmuramic acid kinase [Capnocytophaga sp.]